MAEKQVRTSDDPPTKSETLPDRPKSVEKPEAGTRLSAAEIHDNVRGPAEEEMDRPASALLWSALASGLTIGFSFVAGAYAESVAAPRLAEFCAGLAYPIGFVFVVFARSELFTENTLTAIIPLLARRSWQTFFAVIRLWVIVLAANIAGAHLFALAVTHSSVVSPEVRQSMTDLARDAASVGFGAAIVRGIFAGWLIAMTVWLRAAVTSGEIAIIVILTYVVGLGHLTHIIAGSVEVLYLVWTGAMSEWSYLGGYMVPTLIGNVIGGTALVSALNHAQVVAGRAEGRLRQ